MAQNAGEREVEAGTAEAEMPPHGEPRATALDGEAARSAPHPAQDDGDETAPALGRNPEVEDSAVPPHEPGSMDISHHEETYQSFIRLTIRSVIVILVVLVLLALVNA